MIASVVLGLFAIGLFAIGLLATLFDTGSDSDDGADAAEEPDFELDEAGNLVGTEGDDVITFDEFIEADNPSGILAGGGDDLIRGRHGEGGAGYVVEVDGQAGDDTLHVFANEDPDDLFHRNAIDHWHGGEGVDHFIVELNEVIWDMSASEIDAYSNDDGSAIRLTAASFPDFDPQLKTLELRLQSDDDEFTLASVHVEQAGVVVTYESDTQLDREFLIAVKTDGLTLDQISLQGADRSILLPIAA